jgi:hypothetical protein
VGTPDAREWGRQQAEFAPVWSDEKWRRVGAILGVKLVAQDHERPSLPGPAEGPEQAAA